MGARSIYLVMRMRVHIIIKWAYIYIRARVRVAWQQFSEWAWSTGRMRGAS